MVPSLEEVWESCEQHPDALLSPAGTTWNAWTRLSRRCRWTSGSARNVLPLALSLPLVRMLLPSQGAHGPSHRPLCGPGVRVGCRVGKTSRAVSGSSSRGCVWGPLAGGSGPQW